MKRTLEQGRRKHPKFGGAQHFERTFYFRKRGHFLKIKKALLCLLQNLLGSVPPAPPDSYVYALEIPSILGDNPKKIACVQTLDK